MEHYWYYQDLVGWVAIGIGAACLLGGAYVASQVKHKCTEQLKAGSWKIEHKKVFFDKHSAITKISLLSCGNGGILTPMISPTLAASAAEAIGKNNRREVAFNAGSAFLAGVSLAFGAGAIATAGSFWGGAAVAGKTLGFTVLGTLGVAGGIWIERVAIRDNAVDNNPVYDNINNLEGNDLLPTIDDPGDTSNLEDLGDYNELHAVVTNSKGVISHLETRQRLNRLSGLSRQQLRYNDVLSNY